MEFLEDARDLHISRELQQGPYSWQLNYGLQVDRLACNRKLTSLLLCACLVLQSHVLQAPL